MATKRAPEKKLVNLAFSIKPVVSGKGDAVHFVKPVDIYRTELGDAKKLQKADLEEIDTVKMELPAGLRSFFGPTVAQALSQLSKARQKEATAFKIEIDPGYYSGEEGYVNATCTLYKGTLPEDIKSQPVIAMGETFTAPLPPRPRKAFTQAASVETTQDIPVMKPLALKKPDSGPPAPG